MSEPWKRLELRLPVNHPVWNLPDGSRATIVREWLEVGRRLATIEDDLKDIKEIIKSPKLNNIKEINIPSEKSEGQQGFNKDTFLNHFK